MDSSIKMQLDVRNNALDLQKYMLELDNWESEMRKASMTLGLDPLPDRDIPPPRNKTKRSKPENGKSSSDKPKKISAYDYSAWDKFDVDKACAELDNTLDESKGENQDKSDVQNFSEEEETEEGDDDMEKKLSLIDEAFYEKEMGNNFVKKEKWNDAIKCYTNAINLDSKNPIYYANRSLCFLKLKNFKSAEVDATVAIQLDKKYIKAFQRRAFARMAIGQLKEAKADYEEVLKIEPNNAAAKAEISRIDEKLNKESKISKPSNEKTFNHKQIFKTEKSKPKPTATKTIEPTKNKPSGLSRVPQIAKKIEEIKSSESNTPASIKPKTVSKTTIVHVEKDLPVKEKTIEMADGDKPSPQIFKPLPEWCTIVQPITKPPHKRSKEPLVRINIETVTEDPDINAPLPKVTAPESKIKKEEVKERIQELACAKLKEMEVKMESSVFEIPKTSIQFQNCWRVLKNKPDEAYSYLKKIPAYKLPQIFENSLESDFFSDLVSFLGSDKITIEPEVVYSFLKGLSLVKRFSSMILFMSGSDREYVKKCISKASTIKSKAEISELYALYEIQA